jgi:hypothetical protein
MVVVPFDTLQVLLYRLSASHVKKNFQEMLEIYESTAEGVHQ